MENRTLIKLWKGLIKFHLTDPLPDSLFLEMSYCIQIGRILRLKNPKSFNEKIQWLKLHDRNPTYSVIVDKYKAKQYVADIIGEEYIIPTLGVWDRFDDIDFSKLPNKFVLKCTHDSGSVVMCKEKSFFNYPESKERIEHSLKTNYFFRGREWTYKNVKPRILAEKYIEGNNSEPISENRDYKIWCFNGKPEFFKVDFDRFSNHRANYYDLEGNLLPFGEKNFPPDPDRLIELPKNLAEMIHIAEKLAKGIPFVRVDLYNVGGKIYFGEMTFYPAAGFGEFIPEEYDMEIGKLLDISHISKQRKK